MDVHAKLKKIKGCIEDAKDELVSLRELLQTNYNVNGECIEKNNIDKLESNFRSLIYSLDTKILPLAESNVEETSYLVSTTISNAVTNAVNNIRRYLK